MATNVFSKTPATDNANWANYEFRQHCKVLLAGSLGQVRVTFQSGSQGLRITQASIGLAATAPNISGAPTQLFFGGNAGFTIGANTTITSDWVNLSFLSTDTLIVHGTFASSGVGQSAIKYNVDAQGDFYFKLLGTNDYLTGTVSGYSSSPSYVRGLTLIETQAPAPAVTSVSPNSGPTSGGTAVTVTGTNFTGATAVMFGAANATSVAIVNSTTITCISPANTAGAYHVTVTTPSGTSAQVAGDVFNYASNADAGSYLISGNPTGGKVAFAASAGTYALSGGPATLRATLLASAGAYAITGNAVKSAVSFVAQPGSYSLTGLAANLTPKIAAATGSYSLTGNAVNFAPSLQSASGQYTITGSLAALNVNWVVDGGAYVITLGEYELRRTGFDYPPDYYGIGHYLEEIEKAKQLEKITRKTPAPIVQQPRSAIRPQQPAPQPPVMPQLQDPQVLIARQIEAEQALERQAAIKKRQRQEAEILFLIAS